MIRTDSTREVRKRKQNVARRLLLGMLERPRRGAPVPQAEADCVADEAKHRSRPRR